MIRIDAHGGSWACGTFAGRRTTRLDTVLHFVCNGLGASISKNNQLQYEHLSTNQGVGSSNLSGRAKSIGYSDIFLALYD